MESKVRDHRDASGRFGMPGWMLFIKCVCTALVSGEDASPGEHGECNETEEASGNDTHSRRKRHVPLIEDVVIGEYLGN